MDNKQHIFLIGFKHVGKTTIGRQLAKKMDRPFIDSDKYIESLFYAQHQKNYSCRKIMREYGADFFKALETKALIKAIKNKPAIISLGGGTPMEIKNQELIAPHIIIHITGNSENIFNRIMKKGRPAFFPPHQDSRKVFQQLWDERKKVYEQVTDICIENHDIKQTIDNIYKTLIKRDLS